ncbi:autophagy-related protein 22-like protein [Chytridium lagenaria]|nr:autophagy-related protein 22-like protein [Chytridium lagenaria]
MTAEEEVVAKANVEDKPSVSQEAVAIEDDVVSMNSEDAEITADDRHHSSRQKELMGWYAYGWPLTDMDDYTKPCNTSVTGYSCVVNFGGAYIQTSSFFFYVTVVSVLSQLLCLISFGALADHGSYRKAFLIGFSYISAILTVLFVTVLSDSLWGYASLLYLLSSIAYAVSAVFHNAYSKAPITSSQTLTRPEVPIFCRVDPEITALRDSNTPPKEILKAMDAKASWFSARGFFWSYISGVIQLIFAIGIIFVFSVILKLDGVPTGYGLQVATAFAVFGELPEGEKNYVFFSWKRFGKTLLKARKLKQMMFFLLGWFIFSDAFSTIITVAVLFATNEIGMPAFEIIIVATLVPFAAGIGCLFWNWIQRRFGLTSRQTLIIVTFLYALLPLWGSSVSTPLKSVSVPKSKSTCLEFTTATCRSLFSEICPPGYESEFFSLYAITDKGSSWIGPLVVGAIGDVTGSRRPSFWYLFFAFLVPTIFFYLTDTKKARFEMAAFLKAEREEKAAEKAKHEA